jgi:flagellar biosynthesis protein FlhG
MSIQSEGLRAYIAGRTPAATAGDEPGHRIVVGSGKGGVGTSTIAALLALLVSAAGRDVLLVDGDENLGTLHLLFGVEPRYTLGALRGGEVEPAELLVPLGPSLTLLPGGGTAGGTGDASLSPAERRALFRRVASLYSGYDLVVIDGGSRLDCALSVCGAGIDRLLAVTATDRISVAATYALIKALEGRLPGLPADVVVNRTDAQAATRIREDLRAATDHFLGRTLGYAGAIPEDACLRAGIEAGMTIQDAAAGSATAEIVQGISEQLWSELHMGGTSATPRFLSRRS